MSKLWSAAEMAEAVAAEQRKREARDLYAGALGLNPQDCLFLPPPHTDDQSIRDGAAWLKDMVAKHGGGGEAADAA
jgi:hypothetical protein